MAANAGLGNCWTIPSLLATTIADGSLSHPEHMRGMIVILWSWIAPCELGSNENGEPRGRWLYPVEVLSRRAAPSRPDSAARPKLASVPFPQISGPSQPV